jgi:uncharacterized protein YfaT (DUF1175 family)
VSCQARLPRENTINLIHTYCLYCKKNVYPAVYGDLILYLWSMVRMHYMIYIEARIHSPRAQPTKVLDSKLGKQY